MVFVKEIIEMKEGIGCPQFTFMVSVILGRYGFYQN